MSTEELTEAVQPTSSYVQASAGSCMLVSLGRPSCPAADGRLETSTGHKWVQQTKLAPQEAQGFGAVMGCEESGPPRGVTR